MKVLLKTIILITYLYTYIYNVKLIEQANKKDYTGYSLRIFSKSIIIIFNSFWCNKKINYLLHYIYYTILKLKYFKCTCL